MSGIIADNSGRSSGVIAATAGGLDGVTTGSGSVTISDGDLIMGTSGNGIDFSATADSAGTMASELLDDYEEGVCTMTWVLGSGTAAINTSYNYLNYCKVGQLVHLQGFLYGGAVSSPSGYLRLTGLPFVCLNLSAISNAMLPLGWGEGWESPFTNEPIFSYSYDGLNYFKVYINGDATPADGLKLTSSMYVGGTYLA